MDTSNDSAGTGRVGTGIGALSPAGPTAPASGGADQPLSPEHYRLLELARARRKTLDRAAMVAAFNGWGGLACAALTIPLGVFFTEALIAGVVVGLLGVVELYGRGMLRRLDRRGPVVLGFNQLVLFGLLTAYSLWRIYEGVYHPAELAGDSLQQLEMLGMPELAAEEMITMFVVVLYSAVILASAVYQGATALYYFTRLRPLEAYVTETPAWIVELDKRR